MQGTAHGSGNFGCLDFPTTGASEEQATAGLRPVMSLQTSQGTHKRDLPLKPALSGPVQTLVTSASLQQCQTSSIRSQLDELNQI